MKNGKLGDLYERLLKSVTIPNGDAAVVCNLTLEPTEGMDFNKVMPPTYLNDNPQKGEAAYRYHIEDRYVGGQKRPTVVLDSVASWANRFEQACQLAWEAGELPMPNISVEIPSQGNRLHYVTNMPHRMYDAAIRDSILIETGKPFKESKQAKRVYSDNHVEVLRALADYNPLSILLGCWGSTIGKKRPFKTTRVVTSETLAGMESTTLKAASRIDPLGLDGQTAYYQEGRAHVWTFEPPEGVELKARKETKEERAEEKKARKKSKENGEGKWMKGKVEDANHGNIPPSLKLGGVSVNSVFDRFSLQLQGLYGYSTGQPKEDSLVRAMLACLALYGHSLRSNLFFLRSGCSLHRTSPDNRYTLKGYKDEDFTLTTEEAKSLYLQSVKPLKDAIDFSYVMRLRAGPDLDSAIKDLSKER